MLACMGVARFCVCPVHTNANKVHSMARHGLRTWCTGHTQACRALAQAQNTAPAPAPLEERQLAQLLIQWAGCSGCAQVHHRLQAVGSQAAAAGNND